MSEFIMRMMTANDVPQVEAIEKEAYRWADLGIDTLEEAAVYMQNQLQLQSRAGRIRQVLQIADRRLTPGEEKLIHTWLSWGFGEDEIRMAYEKTALKKQSMDWGYMNAILRRWHQKGLHTAAAIQAGDRDPSPVRAGGGPQPPQPAAQEQQAREDMDRMRRLMEQMKREGG